MSAKSFKAASGIFSLAAVLAAILAGFAILAGWPVLAILAGFAILAGWPVLRFS